MHKKSGISEDGRLSRGNSCSSLDLSESSAAGEHPTNINEHGPDTSHASSETKEDFVNNSNDSENVKNELEFVNNREGLKMEARLEYVNSKESLKMESHFVDEDNGIN